ncbi:hypothetical protein PG996_005267 [Apiospora saccharicola]|uniref:Uncharacterized protein n=1 Tax=Apiospora saccharicola TaxID=335842 RepID=A0ABR1VKZ2_9PEZI
MDASQPGVVWQPTATMPPPKLQWTDYHIAWIALVSDLELLLSRLILDEEHKTPDYDTTYDDNI